MNLTVLYQTNQTGEKLLNNLQKTLEDVEYRIMSINNQDYYQIDIQDRFSTVRRIVNTPRAINNSCTFEQAQAILHKNNIAFGLSEDESINRTYDIVAADLEVISLKVTTNVKGKQQSKYIRERDNQKLTDMARRTVYLLGLDLAMVTIVLTAKRRYKVVQVNPSPEIRDKDLTSFIERIMRMHERDRALKSIEVKMGADPEFMLLNSKTGKLISASEFFPREGIVGCDNIRIPNRQQRPIAEVRPRPELSPLDLTDNIRQALNTASRLAPYRNVRWLAGSQPVGGYSIGGHIHFSNLALDGGLLRALDNYVGIPVFLIENPTTAVRRRRKYGYIGEYRLKDHGGFEYRTPGSWLVSQKITMAVLCLAKLVANRYAELPQNYLNTPEAQKAFYEGDQMYFRSLFISLWGNLEKIDLYNNFKEELQIIPEMVMQEINWDERSDLRRAWKVNQSPKRNYGSSPGTPRQSASASTSQSNAAPTVSTGSTRSGSVQLRGSQVRSSAGNSVRDRRSAAASSSQRGRITSGQIRTTNIVR